MKKLIFYSMLVLIIFSLTASCRKYLDAKPDKSLSTISSIGGLQGFLDAYDIMNEKCTPAGEVASDNYYLTDSLYDVLRDFVRRAYIWGPATFPSYAYSNWQNEYDVVYMSNLALDGLKNIDRTIFNAVDWDYCKGSALLYRGKAFLEIAQVWSLAYDSVTARQDMGIPLRLTADFNEPSVRANNQDTYDQIIKDLKAAVTYLPSVEDNVFRPSKAAAYGLLSRTFMTMRKYKQAKVYADSCLAINNRLLDFNMLDTASSSPFGPFRFSNPEDIMHSSPYGPSANILLNSKVDSTLFESYKRNDLRKIIYFELNMDGTHSFKAAYEDRYYIYNGLATDEIYLNRAECLARIGNVESAMKDLNKLLMKRWKAGTFIPFSANDPEDALKIILKERRKELYYRMLRFMDIKRLNKEGANIPLERIIHGQTYILPPNDPRFALPIPDRVIELSGIQQN